MTIKVMFKYLIGLAILVGLFAKMSWSRSQALLKDYIVTQEMSNLHNSNVAKLNEIENKLKFYILASQDLYKKMTIKRENFATDEVDADIVGADIFTAKNKKYTVAANYTNSSFLKNRDLGNDFFKETLGANPLDFSSLEYNKLVVQRLSGSDKKTDLLAIASPMGDGSVFVVYVDLHRFQSLLTSLVGYSQYMFEPVNGLIASNGPALTLDVNEHPALVALNKNNKTVIQTKYIDKSSGEFYYTSVIRSSSGFYMLTEAPEGLLFKVVYLMQANFAKAVGILLSGIVILLSIMGLFSAQKVKYILKQLEDYSQSRHLLSAYKESYFKDEFDQISKQIYATIDSVEKNTAINDAVKKFGRVNLLEKLNFKKIDLSGAEEKLMLVQLEFLPSQEHHEKDIIVKEYTQLYKAVEEIINQSNGVVLDQLNYSLTLAWGLFDDNSDSYLRGLNSLLEIETYLSKKLEEFTTIKSYMIAATEGAVVVHLSPLNHKLHYLGAPFEEVQKLVQLKNTLDQNIVVSSELASKANKYFNFDPEFKFSSPRNLEDFKMFRSRDVTINVLKLTHKTREIVEGTYEN